MCAAERANPKNVPPERIIDTPRKRILPNRYPPKAIYPNRYFYANLQYRRWSVILRNLIRISDFEVSRPSVSYISSYTRHVTNIPSTTNRYQHHTTRSELTRYQKKIFVEVVETQIEKLRRTCRPTKYCSKNPKALKH